MATMSNWHEEIMLDIRSDWRLYAGYLQLSVLQWMYRHLFIPSKSSRFTNYSCVADWNIFLAYFES